MSKSFSFPQDIKCDYGFALIAPSCGKNYDESDNFYLEGDEIIFMQFTGLHDKTGKGIYEGDICKVPNNVIMTCKFTSGSFRLTDGLCGFYDHAGWENLVEIIGNIYESPHLLEKK